MKQVVAWQCEFCRRKVGMNKTHLAKHEFVCFHNPRRKACQTCGNHIVEWDEEYTGHRFGEATYSGPIKIDYCEAKETTLDKIPRWKQSECNQWKVKEPTHD